MKTGSYTVTYIASKWSNTTITIPNTTKYILALAYMDNGEQNALKSVDNANILGIITKTGESISLTESYAFNINQKQTVPQTITWVDATTVTIQRNGGLGSTAIFAFE